MVRCAAELILSCDAKPPMWPQPVWFRHGSDTWASKPSLSSLPDYVKAALSTNQTFQSRCLYTLICYQKIWIFVNHSRSPSCNGRWLVLRLRPDDGVTYFLLRSLSEVESNPRLCLYNPSYQCGRLHSSWIYSSLIPIPKPGSDSFRPISLTPVSVQLWNVLFSLAYAIALNHLCLLTHFNSLLIDVHMIVC